MDNLIYDLTYFQSLKRQHWIIKLIYKILFAMVIIIGVILTIIGGLQVLGWEIPTPTRPKDGFTGESLYDLMEKDAQISNDVYLAKIRDADVIQSNPWIMIEPVTQNATIYSRDVLNRLTGQQPETLTWQPRTYYEYSDVLYTGLPL